MISELFYTGNFGIERESLRVDSQDRIAQTSHPFRSSALTRDFCESQTEIVTGVCPSVKEAVCELERLDSEAKQTLDRLGEHFWLYSNPPHITSEDEVSIAQFTGDESAKTRYREQLALRYGKRLMLYSGVHFNFSFSEKYLRSICTGTDFEKFCGEFYLRLYKQMFTHSWLVLLLTASSPAYDLSLDRDNAGGAIRSRYSSMRNSQRGYWNDFIPILRHDSLCGFADSIEEYTQSGRLLSASELYLPVRLKPKGEYTMQNLRKGVSHIELRMFDLDPFSPAGVNVNDLEFAHLLLMFLSCKDDFEFTEQLQRQAISDHKNAALCDLSGIETGGMGMIKKAARILDEMEWFFADDAVAAELIAFERRKLYHRPCMRVRTDEIYINKKEGDNYVRASRFFSKGSNGYKQTAPGVFCSLR